MTVVNVYENLVKDLADEYVERCSLDDETPKNKEIYLSRARVRSFLECKSGEYQRMEWYGVDDLVEPVLARATGLYHSRLDNDGHTPQGNT